ncbi:hypothetical protein D3C72_1920760 [compost metagenome]
MAGDAFGQLAPVIDGYGGLHRGVGHHAQHAGTHLVVEAVHDRKHQDHHQHAQGEADHRGEGNEGDEVVAALGACVAGAYVQGQRSEHGSEVRWRKKRRPCGGPWRAAFTLKFCS